MDASERGVLLNNLADLMQRNHAYLAVKILLHYMKYCLREQLLIKFKISICISL